VEESGGRDGSCAGGVKAGGGAWNHGACNALQDEQSPRTPKLLTPHSTWGVAEKPKALERRGGGQKMLPYKK
jgi:hypothetical protein